MEHIAQEIHKNIFEDGNLRSVLGLVVRQEVPDLHAPLLTTNFRFALDAHESWEAMPAVEELPLDLTAKGKSENL